MNRRNLGFSFALSAILLLLAACGQEADTGSAQLLSSLQQSVSAVDVTRVQVTISAADMTSRTVDLTKTGNQWGGLIGQLPAGTNRTLLGQAFDSTGTKLYEGSATGVTITSGETAVVSITLQQVNAPPAFANAAPCITSLIANASSIEPGGTVSLQATAKDPNSADSLSYTWSATTGSFGSASSLSTTWVAPQSTGPATLSLTVTDSKGAATSLSIAITVQMGRGSADVGVALNNWPQVTKVVATPTAVAVNEATTVTATVSDNDGDSLSYQWSAGCSGTWLNATSATAQFTPTAQPAGDTCGNCPLTVTVKDGRGGQTTGQLTICVGPKPTGVFAPAIVDTFQSANSVAAGSTATFRLKASDPQGSALSFKWAASSGTLGTAINSAGASEVTWTAPACLPANTKATLTGTVTNALGLTSSASFSISVGTVCTSANVMLYTNYDGGNFTINVDSNLPNIKLGINSYVGMNITITGPYAGNVTEVVYAGYNGSKATTVTGVSSGIVTNLTAPAATLSDSAGHPAIICNYSGGTTWQGGCNTKPQLQHYFLSKFGGSIAFHRCQYGVFSGTLNTSAGGTCN